MSLPTVAVNAEDLPVIHEGPSYLLASEIRDVINLVTPSNPADLDALQYHSFAWFCSQGKLINTHVAAAQLLPNPEAVCGSQARSLLNQGLAKSDIELIDRALYRCPYSPAGREAAQVLSRAHLSNGEVEAALLYAELTNDRPSVDSSITKLESLIDSSSTMQQQLLQPGSPVRTAIKHHSAPRVRKILQNLFAHNECIILDKQAFHEFVETPVNPHHPDLSPSELEFVAQLGNEYKEIYRKALLRVPHFYVSENSSALYETMERLLRHENPTIRYETMLGLLSRGQGAPRAFLQTVIDNLRSDVETNNRRVALLLLVSTYPLTEDVQIGIAYAAADSDENIRDIALGVLNDKGQPTLNVSTILLENLKNADLRTSGQILRTLTTLQRRATEQYVDRYKKLLKHEADNCLMDSDCQSDD